MGCRGEGCTEEAWPDGLEGEVYDFFGLVAAEMDSAIFLVSVWDEVVFRQCSLVLGHD